MTELMQRGHKASQQDRDNKQQNSNNSERDNNQQGEDDNNNSRNNSQQSKNNNQNGRSGGQKINPTSVATYLKGIKFPANKNDLVKKAKDSDAPADVVRALEQFEEKEYNSPTDVSKELSKIE